MKPLLSKIGGGCSSKTLAGNLLYSPFKSAKKKHHPELKIRKLILMKNAFIFCLSILPYAVTAQEFAPVGAKWHYEVYNSGLNQSQQVVQTRTTEVYECVDEEAIDDVLWRKISVPQNPITSLDFFYVREDDRKIWFYNAESQKTVMLYDLDPELGDIWTYPLSDESASRVPYFADFDVPTDSFKLRVDSISIVTLNGLPAKRLVLSRAFNDSEYQFIPGPVVMEPFGFLESFMIVPGFSIIDVDLPTQLRCYEDDYWGLLSFSDSLTCDSAWVNILTGISTANNDEFQVYPNPGGNQLTISSQFNGPSSLCIRDSKGAVVLKKEFSGPELRLESEIAELPAGIYLIDLTNRGEGKRITRRWMKN